MELDGACHSHRCGEGIARQVLHRPGGDIQLVTGAQRQKDLIRQGNRHLGLITAADRGQLDRIQRYRRTGSTGGIQADLAEGGPAATTLLKVMVIGLSMDTPVALSGGLVLTATNSVVKPKS